jgi:hypothetical protein
MRQVLILLCLALSTSNLVWSQDKPDPIADDLAKAKEAYQTAVAKARDELLKAFATEEKKLLDSRLNVEEKVRRVEQVQNEKKAFETDGTLPTSATMKIAGGKYQIAVSQARLKCENAFQTAAEKYGRIDLAKAKAVLQEKGTYFTGAPEAVAGSVAKSKATLSTTGTAPTTPAPTDTSISLDRNVALWALANKCKCSIANSQGRRSISNSTQLPAGEFRIVTMDLSGYDGFIPAEQMAQIASLPSLDTLVSYSSHVKYDASNLNMLRQSKSLKHLDLRTGLGGDAVDVVASIPNIALIGLEGWSTTDDDLKRLAACPSLGQINLGDAHTDVGLRYLAVAVPKLGALRFNVNHKITPAGLRVVQSVDALVIGPQHMTADFSAAIRDMPRISNLLVLGQVTAQSFAVFQSNALDRIQWLAWGSPADYVVPTDALRSLLNLKLSKHLEFHTVPVNDAHVPFFVNAAPGQTIRLYGTRLTPAGIAQIRQQLPQCTIETDVK